MPRSPWEILGVPETASDEDIRHAYRAKAAKAHPDRGGDAVWFAQLGEAFKAIETADARARWRTGGAAAAAGPGGGVGDVFADLDRARTALAGKAEQAVSLVEQLCDLFGK